MVAPYLNWEKETDGKYGDMVVKVANPSYSWWIMLLDDSY
jgi:hypothetical protein